MSVELTGKVALITGGANGIGAASARRLASHGARVVVADVDADQGKAVADEVGGVFVRCDVTVPSDSAEAVALAVREFGGLDIAFLNAGIGTGCSLGDDFDVETYRRAMAINLDGVVYGAHYALPEVRKRGGQIIATASMAGLMPMPGDPVYGANKAAVVGLVRSLGGAHPDVRVNALCPGFADTNIIVPLRSTLEEIGMPIIPVSAVVDAFMSIVEGSGTGEAWFVQAGRAPEPFGFRNPPGPRAADGSRIQAAQKDPVTIALKEN
ncbi:SDR family NAD(P)-dependent oxidoreductase [Lentzea sp. HUAS12]|uniref:SDR family NAD(P)-dependent oxidoreductase n=1 Tax=Lentzea sp. HUAS12 TaxID=2951806 RepID=UPI00209EB542|nr:SDR family NAD(P)-dependent oxidoreductase [Lentzea sp. HUAS12]USX56490.1 SDR family NAD(P)-dependent oxidoreductase [Lentzea sp. HUAS12]